MSALNFAIVLVGIFAFLMDLSQAHLRGHVDFNSSSTQASDYNQTADNATSLTSVQEEFKFEDQASPGDMAIADESSDDLEDNADVEFRRLDRTECIFKQAKKALSRVEPWRASETKYAYKYLDLSVANPRKLETDCSGFVSWVIATGCGKKYIQQIWEDPSTSSKEAWKPSQIGTRRSAWPSVVARVRAGGFYEAFKGMGNGNGKWTIVKDVSKISHGDLLTYQIKRTGSYKLSNGQTKDCAKQEGDSTDTGHIMIVMGKAYPAAEFGTCKIGRKTLTRYRMMIADSSKKAHFNGKNSKDTRALCSNGHCGVGAGFVYVWADASGKLEALGLRPSSTTGQKGTKCPPKRNQNCHNYVVGRLQVR